jgi:hypothetical protein
MKSFQFKVYVYLHYSFPLFWLVAYIEDKSEKQFIKLGIL